MEEIDFGKLFLSLKLQHIHRSFDPSESGFLAVFDLLELVHNLNWFVDELNLNNKGETVNTMASGWLKKRIQWLKKVKIEVRPDVWHFVTKNKTDKQKKHIEKEAAYKVLQNLKFLFPGLLKFLKTGEVSK
jgi:hypothetical protein